MRTQFAPEKLRVQNHSAMGDLICLKAADCLKKYSTGVSRISLDKLGVSPLNRLVSPIYVHSLGHAILTKEGFMNEHYKWGTVWSPIPRTLWR